MHEIPTFNPRSLYPILGTAMPRTEIDPDTRLPDMLVPDSDGEASGGAFVECRLLVDLLESPAHRNADVRQHLAFAADSTDATGATDHSAVACFVTFNPRARLRILATQTCTWHGAGADLRVAAVDDARAQVVAIDPGVEMAEHPWQACVPVQGEKVVRICSEVGFDLSPSGRKQYWPGRELAPIVDYLPYRFLVKLAYVRHVLMRNPAPGATGA